MEIDREFEVLLSEIEKRSAFQQSGYKRSFLQRRVAIRMRARQISGYANYMRVLKSDPSEMDLLMDRLTVNVTEFFRNPEVFAALEAGVIKDLASERGQVRVWSAGSSEGREAYSLAMIFKKLKVHASITATDIDDTKLASGRAGVYKFNGQKEIDRELPSWARSMLEIEGFKVEVPREIRSMVNFVHHDLLGEKPLKNMDLVLCRNLMIYFPKEAQVVALRKFHEALKEGRYLVIGKTEHIPLEVKDLFRPIDLRSRIFRK